MHRRRGIFYFYPQLHYYCRFVSYSFVDIFVLCLSKFHFDSSTTMTLKLLFFVELVCVYDNRECREIIATYIKH